MNNKFRRIILIHSPLENPALQDGDEGGSVSTNNIPRTKVMGSRRLIYLSVIVLTCFLNIESTFAAGRTEDYERLINIGEAGSAALEQDPDPAKAADIVRPVIEYQADNFRDPFQKYVVESKVKIDPGRADKDLEKTDSEFINNLNVQGIVLGGRFPQAIVNDAVVKVGDTVGEARIIGITKKGISLSLHNHIYTANIQGGKK